MIRSVLYFLLLFYSILLNAQTNDIDIKFGQKIPVRDGVSLSCDLYLPVGLSEPQPALFVLTPYTADGIHGLAMLYSQNGYNVAVVDCRGRGNSEGTFMPFENEGKDGYDVCEWLAKQSWCNGKVGMFQGSYLGMAQWLTMKENPPSLKSVAPTACVCPGIDFPMSNNIQYTYNIMWLGLVAGKASNSNMFGDLKYWNKVLRKMWTEHLPFCRLDEYAGIESKAFQKWVLHPAFDAYYENILPSKADFSRINIPIMTITGSFDDDQHGNMYYYNNFMANASQDAKDKCFLIVGPWDHGGTRRPKTQYRNLTFGENSKLDIGKLHIDWFNWTLKNGPKPDFLKNNVAVYEQETNEWKYAKRTEELSEGSIKFYLASDGKAMNVYHSGKLLTDNSQNNGYDSLRYNPLDTSDTDLRFDNNDVNYAWRNPEQAMLNDKFVYHSEPLSQDVVFTGQAKLKLNINIDSPDADFEAVLYEIKPNGEVIYLTSDIIRCSYRNSLKTRENFKLFQITPVEMKTFYITSRKLTKGSRLRLVFGALNSPYFEKNYNSGKNCAYESSQDVVFYNLKVYHNPEYPSYIELPINKE